MDEHTLKRNFGHDLLRLLAKAKEHGLERLIAVTPGMQQRIARMAPDYGDNELQYFMGATFRQWSLPAEVIEDVSRIHDALYQAS